MAGGAARQCANHHAKRPLLPCRAAVDQVQAAVEAPGRREIERVGAARAVTRTSLITRLRTKCAAGALPRTARAPRMIFRAATTVARTSAIAPWDTLCATRATALLPLQAVVEAPGRRESERVGAARAVTRTSLIAHLRTKCAAGALPKNSAATSTNTEMLNELCRNQRNLIMKMRNKFTCSQLQVVQVVQCTCTYIYLFIYIHVSCM